MQRAVLAVAALFLLAAANSPASAQHHRHRQAHRLQIIDGVTNDNNGRCIAPGMISIDPTREDARSKARVSQRAPVLDANGNNVLRSSRRT
jgi:hypothetical protein